MTWFINYQKTQSIDVCDRGLSYGDGVFETLHIKNGAILAEHFHRQRLIRACRRLFIPFSIAEVDNAFQFIQQNALQIGSQCVKLILTRGLGGRGYLPPEKPSVNLMLGFLKAPDYLHEAEVGVSLAVSAVKASINSTMAGLKHLNRLENVLAKKDLAVFNQLNESTPCFESILLDDNGGVVECVQSNVFWIKHNVLHTSLLNRSGVQGTFRSQVLSNYNGVVNLAQFTLDDVLNADEIFICNGLMGIVPVTNIVTRDNCYPFLIGEKTKHLQCLLNK